MLEAMEARHHKGLAEIQSRDPGNDTPIQICIVLYMQVLAGRMYVAVISVAMRIVATRLYALQN